MSILESSTLHTQKEKAKEKQLTYFILALHNHQPVGNLPEVYSAAFKDAYAPFIEVLYRYPDIKAVLHYSGILLEWIAKNEPSFLDILRDMVQRGQVEIMGGSYYEPILPIIPDSDKRGQILKLSRYLHRKLGAEVQGMWLAERIWEPHLARPLCQAGIRYVVVDDAHFQELGLKSEELRGYYLTEEGGCPLKIFSISEKLRYLIPFEKTEETLAFLGHLGERGAGSLAVLADDGEKFGSWPGTHEHVYEKGWLEEFFRLLQENKDWLRTTTFSEYMEKYPPRGRIYLPAASYREMKQWAGGFWRNFLVRYPESNRMHKKMLAVRKRLPEVKQRRVRQKVREYIWAAQCNCAYWHGGFWRALSKFFTSSGL
jgi:alpha-amylase/alpha-mannosidase (GH57 family)